MYECSAPVLDPGGIKKGKMEDNAAILAFDADDDDNINGVTKAGRIIMMVADGHGQNQGGAETSKIICQELQKFINDNSEKELKKLFFSRLIWHKVYDKLNKMICKTVHPKIKGEYGSTLSTVALGKNGLVTCANSGDSDVYVFSPGLPLGEPTWRRLTGLHSTSRNHERNRIINCGGSIQNRRVIIKSPGKVTLIEPTRSLGHLHGPLFGVVHNPETNHHTLSHKDVVVAASDGLWNYVKPEDIAYCVRENQGTSVVDLIHIIVSLAINTGGERRDNLSVALARYTCSAFG